MTVGTTQEVLVLGAGMVGTSLALELTLRGHRVTLLDRRPPGRETSYGNAGVIQREAVEPYAFPRDRAALLAATLGRDLGVHWRVGGLLAGFTALARYWRNSAPARHRRLSRDYASLIAHCTAEHARLMTHAGGDDLVRRDGLRFVFRSDKLLDAAVENAQRLQREYGLAFIPMDARGLALAEPAFKIPLAGAVHWQDSWSVNDPGMLVEQYARAFERGGGRLVHGDAHGLRQHRNGWQVETDDGPVHAQQAVVALGPWAASFTRTLGYRLPLFVKRGYHRHYTAGANINVPMLDAERGYVMAPQRRGLRLTTGAEIAGIDASPSNRQIVGAEAEARVLLDLGQPVERQPWLGSRPCTADMLPVIGAAPRHPGLWFDFGHGHQGFTLGPASARLLSDLLEGSVPFVDPKPFSPARFAR